MNSSNKISLTQIRYPDHTYIVLTLQKLVHIHKDGEDGEDEDSDRDESGSEATSGKKKKLKRGKLMKAMHDLFGSSKQDSANGINSSTEVHDPTAQFVSAHTEGFPYAPIQKLRTLQRYHGGPNQERMAFMEANSALAAKNYAVCAEQVSIFLLGGEICHCKAFKLPLIFVQTILLSRSLNHQPKILKLLFSPGWQPQIRFSAALVMLQCLCKLLSMG